MNTKNLRKAHLYIGCVFAPALMFFIVTGCWQTFDLHFQKKGSSYHPPTFMKVMSQVHLSAKYQIERGQGHPSQPFKLFVLAMAFFMLITILLGIVLALQSAQKKWIVWACLLGGILLPFLLLVLG